MPAPSVHQGSLHVTDVFSCGSCGGMNESLRDRDVAPDADLDTGKMRHRVYAVAVQEGAPVAATIPLHLAYGTTGVIVAVRAVMIDPPSGGDKAVSVDVQKGAEGTAYATVLTAAMAFNSSIADREVVAGTLASSAVAQDDSLVVVVTLSGSTGSYGTGLLVEVIVDETPV